jgi:FkbH-like protein
VLAKSPSATDELIDAVIRVAPACISERVLLQGIDWRRVAPAKVAAMLDGLQAEGVRLPHWLAKALVVGGHVLPPEHQSGATTAVNVLNSLNDAAGDDGAAAVGQLGAFLRSADDLDQEIVEASVKRLLELGSRRLAVEVAIAHWLRAPKPLRETEEAVPELLQALPPVKVRLTGFSTTHVLATDLIPAFAAAGFHASVAEADFGQALAELIEPAAEERHVLAVMLDHDGFHSAEPRQDPVAAHELLLQKLDMLSAALEAYAEKGSAPVLINTLPVALAPTIGLIDACQPGGAAHSIQLVNSRLADIARRHPQIIMVDSDRALAGVEPRRRVDPKLWFYGRIPFSNEASRHIASAFAGAYRILKRGTAKVLALDLDNTLWGGIYGEDGVDKLLCDDEFPGNAFKAFQRECLRLKQQGFLLALLSKNNPDAISAFGNHPGMLLREDDFVATRINWAPKPDNVRSMAEELNLGLDSFIFLDDSPHEREAMRRMCPELAVPELPADPAARPLWLRGLAATWPIHVTEEDARRSDLYLAEKRRTVLRESAVSFEDYLRGLEQTLIVRPADSASIPRVAQMHMRTNQFNLTTERYDEGAIRTMVEKSDRYAVLHGRALDRFGDHGLVICATAAIEGDGATIQSFLMSCRVVGRGMEMAFLGEVLRHLAQRGVRRVEAAYIPTKKNKLVEDFYRKAGLVFSRSDGDAQVFRWDAGEQALTGEQVIAVRWE